MRAFLGLLLVFLVVRADAIVGGFEDHANRFKSIVRIRGVSLCTGSVPAWIKKYRNTRISKIPFWSCGGNEARTFSTHHVTRAGDSGGPAFLGVEAPFVQVGIISKEITYDDMNEYLPEGQQSDVKCENKSIQVKIEPFLPWIQKETGYSPSLGAESVTLKVRKKFAL